MLSVRSVTIASLYSQHGDASTTAVYAVGLIDPAIDSPPF